ncbi:MAG: 3-oxoacyl-[acyl-carrier-protein] reductase [Candidatus Hydrothermales bacterium]
MLEGKTSIITGGSSGIGKATAKKFVEYGARVILFDKDEERLKSFWEESIMDRGWYFKGDISKKGDIDKFLQEVRLRNERIDVLVNNAGVTKDALLVRMKEEDWDLVLNVNLRGVFLLTREIVKMMMKQESGVIINISSVVGITGNIGQCNYSASKAALIAFTKSLAKEVGSRNIRVIAVAPGFIETPMTEKLPEEVKKKYLEQIPLKRFGKPEEVAELLSFLASSKASYITGCVIQIDGGMV